MPPAIPILAFAAIQGIKSAVVKFVIMAVASLASAALSARDARKAAERAQGKEDPSGRQHIVRSSTSPHRVIYGEAMCSGTLIFSDSTGEKNRYVHIVIALAGHQVEEIGEIYLDDTPLTDSKAAPYVRVKRHLGHPDQAADADLVTESDLWTDNHRLRGIAYLYVRLEWDQQKGPEIWPTGLPNIKAHVKGKNDIFDPRNGATGYTNNWALCIRDYLTSGHGVGCEADEIDDDMMITAANISDEILDPGPLADLSLTAHDWQFKGTAQDFTAVNATLSPQPEYVILLASAADPQLIKNNLSFSGADNRFVRLIIKRVVGVAWDGKLFYTTSGHGHSSNYYATIPEVPIDDEWHYLEIDMHALSAGGDDWAISTITGMRFDFAQDSNAAIYVEWIRIGNREDLARYTCNGTFFRDGRPADVVEELITAGAGTLCYSQGKYRLRAGAYSTPSGSLNEAHLRDDIKIRPRQPKSQLTNGVRGLFVSPQDAWQMVDFPAVKNSLYVAQDGGHEMLREIELPFTTDPIRAQMIAKLHLERQRQPIVVEFPGNFACMQYTPGDVVLLSIALCGFVNKPFRVIEWAAADGGAGVNLTMQEEAAEVYDWNYGQATKHDPAPDTLLPDPGAVGPVTNINVESGNAAMVIAGDGSLLTRMMVSWTSPDSGFIVRYEIEYIRIGDTSWQSTVSIDTSTAIGPVAALERYNLRVRAVNSLQARGEWAYFYNHMVDGKTAPPPTPSSFLVSRQPDGTREFTATYPNRPADFAGYRIYWALGTGKVIGQMQLMNKTGLITAFPFESNQLAAGAYTFALTSVDTSGLESGAIYIETSLADPRLGSVAFSSYPASEGWPGNKTNCHVESNGWLEANSGTTWDTTPATWDGYIAWNQGAISPIAYEHPEIDLGFDLVFTPLISMLGDGTPTVEIQWKPDGGTYSAWVIPEGVVTARYLKVKISVAGSAPLIKQLSILFSAATISEEINDLLTSTLSGSYRLGVGDIRLPISKPFSRISQVQVALQGVGAGWSWVLEDKDVIVGPRLRIYNGSGAAADANIDANIRGM